MDALPREHEPGAAPADLRARFTAFVVEQFPFALDAARDAFALASKEGAPALEEVRGRLLELLARDFEKAEPLGEATPGVSVAARYAQELDRVALAVEGFFQREAIRTSITPDEKRWMLAGIVLTRAVDNQLKQIFLTGELRWREASFQGKGFRSLGQEAIHGAALRLRRGAQWSKEGRWTGDVIGPLIRDLGVLLAFTDDVSMPLNAQAGKSGPPMDGKDLHVADFARGVFPPSAPLAISAATLTGVALGFALKKEPRVAVSFIGEGGTSLGAWHEAINLASVRRLPIVFCVQNNQTALATPVSDQSRVRVFGEKAAGYGIPHVTIDGTDPEAIAAAFSWAAERARAGEGPSLLELVAMRMCGHAHHDDMLYLGAEPPVSFELPPVPEKGYANRDLYGFWAARDPLASYARRLVEEGVVTDTEVEAWKREAAERCAAAFREIKERPWPDPSLAGVGVTGNSSVPSHAPPGATTSAPLAAGGEARVEPAPPFSPAGATYLEAVSRGVADALERDDTFVLGEDVGAPYGNAFLLLKPLLSKHADRILNAPIAEGGIIAACVGAALVGLRPIGEMQFNDFVATGFDQLVNNAAKLRYRAGLAVPMVLRMPWGGLRHAGPYHSQDTSPWFHRAFGLKIVAPSTPYDARALMRSAVLDDDPVLYYEHIALYRDPAIRQALGEEPGDVPIGKAAFRRVGTDLSLIAYGAYVHRALACAARLEKEDGVHCDVLDLRSLAPLDWEAVALTVARTGKVLLVGEDSRTGSILESIASKIGERLFELLDGPVRVLGSLDTPVPYAPSLEEAFLVSDELLLGEARSLLAY